MYYRGMKYPKIKNIFLRNANDNFKTVLHGHYSCTEFQYLAECKWTLTEKVDGTNIRVTFDEDGAATFHGRTDRASIPTHLFEALALMFKGKEDRVKETFCEPEKVILFGEGYGAGIQKGGSYRPTPGFVMFDVYIGSWLERSNVLDIGYQLGIDVVPLIGILNLKEAVDLVSKGLNSRWGDFIAEGVVARPQRELQNRLGERIITKIKWKDMCNSV